MRLSYKLIAAIIVSSSSYANLEPSVMFLQPYHIKIIRHDISINPNKIKVSTVFDNLSALDSAHDLMFPKYNSDYAEQNNQSPGNPSFYVNGKKIDTKQLSIAVTKQGYDITSILNNLKIPLDPTQAAQQLQRLDSNNLENTLQKLKENNLIDQLNHKPKWQAKSFYHWKQAFPAGEQIHLQYFFYPRIYQLATPHSNYSSTLQNTIQKKSPSWLKKIIKPPVISEESETNTSEENMSIFYNKSEQLEQLLSKFCARDSDYKTIKNYIQMNNLTNLYSKQININLLHNSYWAHSIDKFTLQIDYTSSKMPLFCWNNQKIVSTEFVRTGPHNILYTASNYIPAADFQLLLID